jgi:acetolactate synthase-1/2/3 large subunit
MRKTGAEIVWDMLHREGVEVVFGIPGGGIIHTYHPRQEYGVHHVLVRHEQSAAHAADGYARASGRVGVAMATSGPGATNLVTGIATAMMDSSPIVCITGQVSTSVLGTDAFQEADITGITLPITKHNFLVTDVDDLATTIHDAFEIARSGRPGPVLVDLPSDVQRAETEFVPPEGPSSYALCPAPAPDPDALDRAVELIDRSHRPVILAGRGVLLSGTADRLLEFAEKTSTPVAVTLLGKGAFPPSHRLFLGMMGMHGHPTANHAIQEADLLIALGMRFDDRVTGNPAGYAVQARKIHVDIDEAEIDKVIATDVAVHADLRTALAAMHGQVRPTSHDAWIDRIQARQIQDRSRDTLHQPPTEDLPAPHIIDAIYSATGGDAVVVTDVGQNQMWAAQYYATKGTQPFLSSGGLGTMGFGLPAAIGAQFARPNDEVWAIVGDGGFQMSLHELATLVQEQLPIRIALINNHCLGMVRQWQTMFYDGRYEATDLLNPDFARIAEAYGIGAYRASGLDAARDAIAAARDVRGPVLVEFEVAREGELSHVYPMVPRGAALDEMIHRTPVAASVPAGRSSWTER